MGYSGYQVSNYGRVKSFKNKKERIMNQTTTKQGYKSVSLRVDGKTNVKLVHRLVWEAFNGPIPKELVVNHINEDKSDNRLENLNLLTLTENFAWGTARQRLAEKLKGRKLTEETKERISISMTGKLTNDNRISKPIIQTTRDGEFIKEWPSSMEISRQLGYSRGTITDCCRGTRKTAYNYKWKFKS